MEPKGEPKRARDLQKGALRKSIDFGCQKGEPAGRHLGVIFGPKSIKNAIEKSSKNRYRKSRENERKNIRKWSQNGIENYRFSDFCWIAESHEFIAQGIVLEGFSIPKSLIFRSQKYEKSIKKHDLKRDAKNMKNLQKMNQKGSLNPWKTGKNDVQKSMRNSMRKKVPGPVPG